MTKETNMPHGMPEGEEKKEKNGMEITVEDSGGIHRFNSYEELMRWREEKIENAD